MWLLVFSANLYKRDFLNVLNSEHYRKCSDNYFNGNWSSLTLITICEVYQFSSIWITANVTILALRCRFTPPPLPTQYYWSWTLNYDFNCNLTHTILSALISHTSLSPSRNTCLGSLECVCSFPVCINILVGLAGSTQICWFQEKSTYSLFYALLRFLQTWTVIPYDFLYCVFLYHFPVFG
jgi:hypothetical protein